MQISSEVSEKLKMLSERSKRPIEEVQKDYEKAYKDWEESLSGKELERTAWTQVFNYYKRISLGIDQVMEVLVLGGDVGKDWNEVGRKSAQKKVADKGLEKAIKEKVVDSEGRPLGKDGKPIPSKVDFKQHFTVANNEGVLSTIIVVNTEAAEKIQKNVGNVISVFGSMFAGVLWVREPDVKVVKELSDVEAFAAAKKALKGAKKKFSADKYEEFKSFVQDTTRNLYDPVVLEGFVVERIGGGSNFTVLELGNDVIDENGVSTVSLWSTPVSRVVPPEYSVPLILCTIGKQSPDDVEQSKVSGNVLAAWVDPKSVPKTKKAKEATSAPVDETNPW